MTTDYDAPRTRDDETSTDSLHELAVPRNHRHSGRVDEDEAFPVEGLELPGADLSHEELIVRVLPQQTDEFTCMECFIVQHRSQLVDEGHRQLICSDCAG